MKIKIMIIMAGLLGFSGVWASSDKSDKPQSTEQKKAEEIEISYAEAEKRVAKGVFGKIKDPKHWPYVYLPVWIEKTVDEYSIGNRNIIRTNEDGTIIAQKTKYNEVTLYNFVTKKITSLETEEPIIEFQINNNGSTIVTIEYPNDVENILNFYTNGILDKKRSGYHKVEHLYTKVWAISKDLSLFFIAKKWNKGTKVEIYDSSDKKNGELITERPVRAMATKQGDTLALVSRGSASEYFIEIYKKNVQDKSITYNKIYEFKTKASSIETNNDASIILNGNHLYYRTKDDSYKKSKQMFRYITYTMNNNGSMIYISEQSGLYKWTNIVFEYWNQLASAHLDMIQAFYYGLNKLDDKQFTIFKSMPWPIIQAIIKIYPVKFTKEQTAELKAIKADFDKQKTTAKEQKSDKETEKKDKGESKKTAEGDKDKK